MQLMEENDDKNIFCQIEKKLITRINNEKQFIEDHIIPSLIKFFDVVQDVEEQNVYDLRLKTSESHNDKIILEAFKNETIIASYNTKLSNNERSRWDNLKVDKNTYILYNTTTLKSELHIYTFNMKFKKIQLQSCFNVEFLKYTIKNYNNYGLNTLDIDEINEIAKNKENDDLKKQWISHSLNHEYFLVHYGEKLLTSAIKHGNIELMETIIKKTLENFKENHNIYILSIICNNVPYLESTYDEFLLKHYNEMILFINSSNQKIIYNNFDHLHSFCMRLRVFRFVSRIDRMYQYCKHKIWFRLLSYIYVPFVVAIVIFIIPYDFIHFTLIGFMFYILYSQIKFTTKFKTKPKLMFIVPFPNYMTYPKDYSSIKELLFPQYSPFSQQQSDEFYKTWNGEAIINFKWRTFGRYYYAAIWFLFTIYLICFTLASSVSSEIINEKAKEKLLISSFVLGLFHLSFGFRQFVGLNKVLNFWSFFDLCAYMIPTVTTSYSFVYRIMYTQSLVSVSCLLLDIKFLLFFRVFESFGIYFAIIIGVLSRIFSFLFILLCFIVSFAHAFFVLLKPTLGFSENNQGNLSDPNNPWALVNKYHQISDGKISPEATLIQEPDEYTNLFSNFLYSILSMYLFLMGDRNSLASWSPENQTMIILTVLFSFIIVIYLMNLFIGLLNNAIDTDNGRASYLAQKAEILKEIELVYLFPKQRRWEHWFPDIIYYYADVDKTRKSVRKLMNEGIWNKNNLSKNQKDILKLLAIEDY